MTERSADCILCTGIGFQLRHRNPGLSVGIMIAAGVMWVGQLTANIAALAGSDLRAVGTIAAATAAAAGLGSPQPCQPAASQSAKGPRH